MAHGIGRKVRAAALLGSLLAHGCGSAEESTPPAEVELFPRVDNLRRALRDAGLGDYLGAAEPVSESPLSPASPWLRQDFDPSSGVMCANGGPFFTAYRKGTSNSLVIVLDSGGACWNDITCALGTASTSPSLPGREGILSAWNNLPTDNWHTVFVPYCDASVFAGDNVVEFPRAGERTFHGLRNLSAALDVAATKIDDPDRVLIIGQSAGSYGSIFAIGPARLAFPESELFLFADSGPGITNPDNELQLSDFRANWRFTERLPCASCDPQYLRYVGWMLRNDPNFSRAGLFSFTEDEVIRQFLGTIKLFSFDLLPADTFASLIRSEAGQLEKRFPGRFEYYLAPGTGHIVSDDDERFEETIVENVSVLHWYNGLIRRNEDWRTVDHERQ